MSPSHERTYVVSMELQAWRPSYQEPNTATLIAKLDSTYVWHVGVHERAPTNCL